MMHAFRFDLVCVLVSACFLTACTQPGDAADRGKGDSAPVAADRFKDCAVEGLETIGRCGTVTVPENPSDPNGQRLSLNVLVVPAADDQRKADPIFYFEGGPGGSATKFANVIADYVLPKARSTRDLVFIDQRGTGQSNGLICPQSEKTDLQSLLTPGLSASEIDACRTKLETHADLRFYSTEHAANDVEAVRRALGYDKINLLGSSYGTRLALAYMRQQPGQVRSAVLISVVAMDRREPLNTAPDTQHAIDQLTTRCAADEKCRSAYPDLARKLRDATSAILTEDQPVLIKNPVSNSTEQGMLGADAFRLALRGMLYEPWGYARLPSFIEQAANGDFTLFAEEYASINADYGEENYADGLYYTILCSEDFDFAPLDEARALAEGTSFGDVRIRLYEKICADWPRAQLSDGFLSPVAHAAPVLIFSGALDATTPPKYGEQVGQSLANATHLIVDNDGHNVGESWPGCAQDIVAAFLESLDAMGLETQCLDEVAGPDWILPE